tara:strand:+ start:115 stop:501 length:387 start_codon:yes stop_codon:yes gene_type:complete
MKKKILIVVADYYKNISKSLLKSAIKEIKYSYNIKIVNVPGVFEIPIIISKNINKYSGFIALGCVIKGKTPHFNFISKATIDAIMQISIQRKKPVANGIITCLNMKQAIERKSKGQEAAFALKSILSQ